MAKRRVVNASLGIILAIGLVNGVWAEGPKEYTASELEELSCGQFLELNTTLRPRVIYWIDGVSRQGGDDTKIHKSWFEIPVESVVNECQQKSDQQIQDVLDTLREKFADDINNDDSEA